MNINDARVKIEDGLKPILDKALAEGLTAKLEIINVGKDIFKEETDDKKVKFISAQVSILVEENSILDITFGIAAECYKGICNEGKIDEDLKFAEDRAAEFFEELSEAENKDEFLKARLMEEKELTEKAAEEISKTVRSSWIGSIVALCVGGAILVAAAVVSIILL